MNGERVGTWSRTTAGVDVLAYDATWLDSPHGRPLSLTLPVLPGNTSHRGPHVTAWFENLLPDSVDIRRRIASRFRIDDDARTLLAEIGRDCVGAVQLLADDDEPSGAHDVPLTEADVARTLRSVTSDRLLNIDDTDANVRIAVAGAQEKTALMYRDGRWYRPGGNTPSTHILKLPLGVVGNMRYDLAHSVENEWLCLRLLGALGFDVADAEMLSFTDDVSTERVLSLRRFDREWRRDGRSLVRLPQEDLCQATGTAPNDKYESDGGPGIREVLEVLRGGSDVEGDVRAFTLAQFAFWLLAATDGHAKNFSIFLRRDGYVMTPLYDVVSAWPIIGRGANSLPIQKAKLAMALRCNDKEYHIQKIGTRHWRCLSDQSGVPLSEFQALAEGVPEATDQISSVLPSGFPQQVAERIFRGLREQATRFLTA